MRSATRSKWLVPILTGAAAGLIVIWLQPIAKWLPPREVGGAGK